MDAPAPLEATPNSAVQRGARPAPGDAQAPTGSGRRFTPLASVRAHWMVGAAVAALVTMLGVPVAYLKGKPRYQTSAVIQVAPRFAGTLTGGGDKELELQSNTQYREFVQQQVRSVNRFDIAKAALAALDARHIPWRKPPESESRAVERLQWALQVKPVPDTYLIQVSYEDEVPDHMAVVVNTVVEMFLATAKREELYDSDDRIQRLKREREQIERQLVALRTQRTSFADKLGITTFNEATRNPYDELLLGARTQLSAARQRRIEAAARASLFDPAAHESATAALGAAAEDLVVHDNGLMALKSNLYQRRAALLAKASGLAPEHGGRQAIEKELREIDEEMERVAGQLRTGFASMLTEKSRADLFVAERTERDLSAQVDILSSMSRSFAADYQQAVAVGSDVERLRRRSDAVDDRIDFLRLEGEAPGFFRLVTPARMPEIPIAGGRKKLAMLALAAGLMLGVAVMLAIDFLDPRVHTSDELKGAAGFAVLAAVADRGTEQAIPVSDDGIRRLVTSLLRDRRDHGTTVVALTGVKPGSGTTELALLIANEMVARGLRPLIVETNTLSPDARYVEAGAITTTALLDGAPLPDPGPAPVLAAAGQAARRLEHLDALQHVLAGAGAYDFVLLDAAPLLLSPDTAWIAGIADLTLLVARASSVTRREVKRALALLESAEPRGAGVMLNRVAYQHVLRDRAADAREFTADRPRPRRSSWPWKKTA